MEHPVFSRVGRRSNTPFTVLILSACQEPFFLQEVVDGNLTGEPVAASEAFVDYVVSSPGLSTPEPYSAGGAASGSFTISNSGFTAGSLPVQWGVYASANNANWGTNDTELESGSQSALTGGSSVVVNFSGSWPSSGTFYLIVRISSLEDSNSANNQQESGPYTVGP